MAGTTISGVILTSVALTNASENPAYVAGTISVTSAPALTGSAGIAWTVTNNGLVSSGSGYGISLAAGGTVTNNLNATISGFSAVYQTGAAGTVINDGVLSGIGQFGYGIELHAGGGVTNQANGTITGNGGVYLNGAAGSVVNAGTLVGTSSTGILLGDGGSVINQTGGTISGNSYGVLLSNAGGTVVNAGSIAATGAAVQFDHGYTNRLIIDPGAAFTGAVDGGNTIGASQISTLELASGTIAGTLSGLGTQFTDFAQVAIDPGAVWTLTNAVTEEAAQISNAGTLFAISGTSTVITSLLTAPVDDSGELAIDHAGDLILNIGSVDTTQSVTFADGTGVLTIGTLGGFSATIVNFIAGDEIVVQGTSIASTSFNTTSQMLTLFNGSDAAIGTLQFGASVTGTDLGANSAGNIGLVSCFAAGTRIKTERGEIAVEKLRIGDRIPLVLGDSTEPVVWIGQRHVRCVRHPRPNQVWPVQIKAGAFGPRQPHRDMFLSPDHAVYVRQVLIPVKLLVNGTSITQVPMDDVTYYHVELPRHEVLLAEGLPVESYLSAGDRSDFSNAASTLRLFPDFAAPAADIARVWDALGRAPLIVSGPELDAARDQVNARAALNAPAAAGTFVHAVNPN
jgi:hypothetical protein